MKIMVADDHKTSQLILSKSLKQLGFGEPLFANNGQEVLEKLPGSGVDLLFLDWHMPELNGFETLKKIRATPELAKLPVIMVTSEAHSDNIKQAIQAGVNQYMVKPFDFKSLAEKLDDVLQHHPCFGGAVGKHRHPVALLAAFTTTTLETLGSLTALSVRAGDVRREKAAKTGDVCSVIGMAGKTPGAILLVISNPLATRVVGAMLRESDPPPEVVQDGIEEIINIIAGRARAALEKSAYGFEISLATTVCGQEQMARPGKKCCQVWSIPFFVEDGEFILELRIAEDGA